MHNFKEIYQKFLQLKNDYQWSSKTPVLDPVEQELLGLLSGYWLKNQRITVMTAMEIVPGISRSTVFRYLKKLRAKGYVQLVLDLADNRIKYVEPTDQADRYFAAIGKLLVEANS